MCIQNKCLKETFFKNPVKLVCSETLTKNVKTISKPN